MSKTPPKAKPADVLAGRLTRYVSTTTKTRLDVDCDMVEAILRKHFAAALGVDPGSVEVDWDVGQDMVRGVSITATKQTESVL